MARPTCQRKGKTLGGARPKHSPTLLSCRVCGVKWCWKCALRFGKAFGPSHPKSGFTMKPGTGNPAYLIFTCTACYALPHTPAHRREHL